MYFIFLKLETLKKPLEALTWRIQFSPQFSHHGFFHGQH